MWPYRPGRSPDPAADGVSGATRHLVRSCRGRWGRHRVPLRGDPTHEVQTRICTPVSSRATPPGTRRRYALSGRTRRAVLRGRASDTPPVRAGGVSGLPQTRAST